MKITKRNRYTTLILLVFISQVMSVPFETCDKNMLLHHQSPMSMDMSSSKTHDMSKMKSMDMDHEMSEDCCGSECNCLVSSCVSVMMDAMVDADSIYKHNSIDLSPLRAFFVNHHNPLIHRPPISS